MKDPCKGYFLFLGRGGISTVYQKKFQIKKRILRDLKRREKFEQYEKKQKIQCIGFGKFMTYSKLRPSFSLCLFYEP